MVLAPQEEARWREFWQDMGYHVVLSRPMPEENTDQRAQALAAKQLRGHGPPSSSGWRGRERTTKYQRR